MREPAFWWRDTGLAAALLSPLGMLYGGIAARRMAQPGASAGLPVICVGNFTLGGTGKTPTAIAIARMLEAAGERPFCLTRGYGGRLRGPLPVDAGAHHADDVGDEALLLARAAPTIVSRDRAAGAHKARAMGASVIVMDDGLQNPSLAKTLSIAVIDGRRGIGNGKVFPAGPLRAPLADQLERVNALLVMGGASGAADVIAAATKCNIPILHGQLQPDAGAATALKGRKVLAFAGIGDPQKFFATLDAAGIEAPLRRAFADHHRYSAGEAAELVAQAERDGLDLLTTEKDLARMAGDPALEALAGSARALPVTLAVNEDEKFRALVLAAARTKT